MKRKLSLLFSLMNNGGKRSVLENIKVNRMLNLNAIITKRGIKMITSLLKLETLH